ncbi:CDP-diacylglycerol diphosphatase, partial [Helicobacter pylori]
NNNLKNINSRWSPLSGGLNRHKYLVASGNRERTSAKSPFIMLNKEVPNAHKRMGGLWLSGGATER